MLAEFEGGACLLMRQQTGCSMLCLRGCCLHLLLFRRQGLTSSKCFS